MLLANDVKVAVRSGSEDAEAVTFEYDRTELDESVGMEEEKGADAEDVFWPRPFDVTKLNDKEEDEGNIEADTDDVRLPCTFEVKAILPCVVGEFDSVFSAVSVPVVDCDRPSGLIEAFGVTSGRDADATEPFLDIPMDGLCSVGIMAALVTADNTVLARYWLGSIACVVLCGKTDVPVAEDRDPVKEEDQ